jgi:competence protein ComEC
VSVTVGPVRLDVLAAKPLPAVPVASEGESADENDSSLVMRATVGALTVLLCGDVEDSGQRAAVTAVADLRADVLLIPHHGSSRQEPDFWARTGATAAIASVGADNSYGHPAAKTVRLAESLGMSVLRTDEHGSIAVSATDSGLRVTKEKNGQ